MGSSWVQVQAWFASVEAPSSRVAVYSLLATTVTAVGGVAIAFVTSWGRQSRDEDLVERVEELERELHGKPDRPVELRAVQGVRRRRRR